jgi:hypothetical protein
MQDFIVSETNKIFNKAIKRISKKEAIETDKVSILLSLEKNEESNVQYTVCHNYIPVKNVGIMEILGVLIDLKGYSLLVPPQIKKILEDFELENSSKDVEIGVFLNPEDEDEVLYFLFKEGQLVRKFELTDVLKLEMV